MSRNKSSDDNKKINVGIARFHWKIPEFQQHERTKRWYIIAVITGIFLLIFAFIQHSFLFAVIIILIGVIMVMQDGSNPKMIEFTLTDEGVLVSRDFYDYDDFRDFAVIYKPQENVERIYFAFKNVIRQRLSIPLAGQDPMQIRDFLLKYLKENLERTDQPLSESLAQRFKL